MNNASDWDPEDWYGLIFGLGFLVLVTILLVVILLQLGAFSRARIARREKAMEQELISKYESLADQTAEHQKGASAELATIRERLDAIETLLREVE
jgi:ABC-type transport system involved in cytochrome bd biosynthesis fused ATPase/permease subunit